MTASITSISPAFISPVSSGVLTIVGSGYTGAKAVSVEGRACTEVVATSDTEITCKWPKRATNGKFDYSGGEVSVVITLADDTTISGTVIYMATRDGRAVLAINSRIAAASVQDGFFYDWSAAEIVGAQVDPSTWQTGTWKRVVSYIEGMDYVPEAACAGFRTRRIHGCLDAVVPLKALTDGTQEASLIISDLVRALMLDIGNGGISDTTEVTKVGLYVIEGLAAGSLLCAGIRYDSDVQTIENDPTQNISWNSIQQGG